MCCLQMCAGGLAAHSMTKENSKSNHSCSSVTWSSNRSVPCAATVKVFTSAYAGATVLRLISASDTHGASLRDLVELINHRRCMAHPAVLPTDVLCAIFARIALADVASAARTCRAWFIASRSPTLWRPYLLSVAAVAPTESETRFTVNGNQQFVQRAGVLHPMITEALESRRIVDWYSLFRKWYLARVRHGWLAEVWPL